MEKRPMININEKKPKIQPARKRIFSAAQKSSVASQRKCYQNAQTRRKRRTEKLHKMKRDPENTRKSQDSGNPTKLKVPRHEEPKLQKAESSKPKSEKLRKNETRHVENGNAWNLKERDTENIGKLRDSGNSTKLKAPRYEEPKLQKATAENNKPKSERLGKNETRHEEGENAWNLMKRDAENMGKLLDSGNSTKLKYPSHEEPKLQQATTSNSRSEAERPRNSEARHGKGGNTWDQQNSDPEETEKLQDSGSPAKLKNPRNEDLKQQQSSRARTGGPRRNESGHGNSESTWNHDVMIDITENRKRMQLEMTTHLQNCTDTTNEKERKTRNSGSPLNPQRSISERQIRKMNNKSSARSTTAGSLESGGSTRNITNNWEIIKLRKTHGKKMKLEINKRSGNEHGGSE